MVPALDLFLLALLFVAAIPSSVPVVHFPALLVVLALWIDLLGYAFTRLLVAIIRLIVKHVLAVRVGFAEE